MARTVPCAEQEENLPPKQKMRRADCECRIGSADRVQPAEHRTGDCADHFVKWWACRDMHPAKPVKSRLLRCLSFRPEKGAHRETRIRTDDALDVAPLLLGYMSIKIGNPGGIRTRNNPIESRVPWPVRRQGHGKWRNAEDMLLMPHGGGTISLAPNAGAIAHTLTRSAFGMAAGAAIPARWSG